MSATLEKLREWMEGKENEHLEFKEAKTNYHFDDLVKYCAALANEGGGTIILGVTNKPPRKVVGRDRQPRRLPTGHHPGKHPLAAGSSKSPGRKGSIPASAD